VDQRRPSLSVLVVENVCRGDPKQLAHNDWRRSDFTESASELQ